MSIKNIVFDMGNVLLRYDVDEILNNFTTDEIARNIMKRELFKSVEWLERDNGDCTTKEAIESVSKRVEDKYKPLVAEIFNNWYKYRHGVVEMEQFVARLYDSGYQIYLLSNVCDDFHELKKNIPAIKYFKDCFLSCDYHMLKPEKEIYYKFFEVFNLKAEECFFIDDLPANIYASNKVGMKGHIFDWDIKALEERLKQEGCVFT